MKDLLTFSLFAEVCGDLCGVESNSNDHPNKMPFTGVLLIVDEPSARPPNGADGHRILVPKDIAKKNLESLIGMGLNYQPGKLNSHLPRHKVGVITKAWIDGNKVMCSGTIWIKDFPEAKKELKANGLGMSMELANVLVKNKHDPIWKLVDFHFTGATVLYKNAAAYQKTSLAAASAILSKILGGIAMSKVKDKKRKTSSGDSQLAKLVGALGTTIKASIQEGMKPFGEKLESISASVKDHGKAIIELAASGHNNDSTESISAGAESGDSSTSVAAGADSKESDELEAAGSDADSGMDAKKMKAAKKKKPADSSSSSSSSSMSDSGSDSFDAELAKLSAPAKGTKAGPDEESSNPEFGNLNKNAKNKGRKNNVNASAHSVVKIAAASHKRISGLKAELDKYRKKDRTRTREYKKLESELADMQAQVSNFTESNVAPRALPAAVTHLLAKGGYDVNELTANGNKLTVAQVDEMLASAPVTLTPLEKATMKNNLLEKGLMEIGEINRNII